MDMANARIILDAGSFGLLAWLLLVTLPRAGLRLDNLARWATETHGRQLQEAEAACVKRTEQLVATILRCVLDGKPLVPPTGPEQH